MNNIFKLLSNISIFKQTYIYMAKEKIKPTFKKVSEKELEQIKRDIKLKLKKQRKEENQQLYTAYFFYIAQAILLLYGLYKIFYDKPFF